MIYLVGLGKEVIKSFQSSSSESMDWLLILAQSLPEFNNWQHEQHEIQCMNRVNQMTNKKGVNRQELFKITEDSLFILAAILCRPENKPGYGKVVFPEGYLSYYPVNIESVSTDWSGHLEKLSIQSAMALFSQTRCLDAHLRVAMRKLSQQGKNTFRFEPGELGLSIRAIPRAANTTPRFKQAIRIITDLGLLSREDGLLKTTQRGELFIKAAT